MFQANRLQDSSSSLNWKMGQRYYKVLVLMYSLQTWLPIVMSKICLAPQCCISSTPWNSSSYAIIRIQMSSLGFLCLDLGLFNEYFRPLIKLVLGHHLRVRNSPGENFAVYLLMNVTD